ncbi:ABC transporter substrate-binding protein [Thermogemmatispora carboxidivorans]|uniref:ABC transporter substrate-binding protein n=1 Tax=Thermogemmatispora carboxidivorans TaxID=1382306 RepID=UPI00069C5C59|nr:ABC transporter substrate-binding protein [Thermogemmatispora carboxidivorans]
MNIYDRRARKELDLLVEEYLTTSTINRRQFLQRATTAGLSLSAATALLAACGGTNTGTLNTSSGSVPKVSSIDVLTQLSGAELAAFNAINTAFTQKTGIKVNVEPTSDLRAVLSTRVRGNNPPDVAGMSSVPEFQQYAAQGKLLQLDRFFTMSQIEQQYARIWLDVSSYNGHLYAVIPRVNTKSTVWYSPKQFKANGYTPSQTWDEMIALSNKIASSGKYPWSLGVEGGSSTGWPAADWVDQIYLSLNGPELSQQWVEHKIPWTHPSVKQAFQLFGEIVNGRHYISGAPQSILATNFQDAAYLPFENPPKAYMYFLGDFTASFLKTQFPGIQPGVDFDFFPFPTITPQYANSVTGIVNILSAFRDNDGTRQYMEFLASPEGQSIWPKQGGAVSVNKQVPLSVYPDPVSRRTAELLLNAKYFSVGQDDLLPSSMEQEYWKGLLAYIQNPSQLDSILRSLEDAATRLYSS